VYVVNFSGGCEIGSEIEITANRNRHNQTVNEKETRFSSSFSPRSVPNVGDTKTFRDTNWYADCCKTKEKRTERYGTDGSVDVNLLGLLMLIVDDSSITQ
jgi:hypothetical protein